MVYLKWNPVNRRNQNGESSYQVFGLYIGKTEIHNSGWENVSSAKSPTIKSI